MNESIDQDVDSPANCTAHALSGYLDRYDGGVITGSEYYSLRQDASDDEHSDTGGCTPAAGERT